MRPLAVKVRRAREAMANLLAHYVSRELVTVEANAKSAVARHKRGVEVRRNEIDQCKVLIGRVSRGGRVGDQLGRDLVKAEAELALEVDKLEEASAGWEDARSNLDGAIRDALDIEVEGEVEAQ